MNPLTLTEQLLLLLVVICVIGQAATVFLIRRCLAAVLQRQVLQLVIDDGVIEDIAATAAERLDERGVFGDERVMH